MLGVHGYLGAPREIFPLRTETGSTALKWRVTELKEWCEETGDRKTLILSAVSQNLLNQRSA